MQAISYHGLELLIPAGWKRNDARCGTPQRNTVIIEDDSSINSCLPAYPSGLTVVWLTRLSGDAGQRYAAAAKTTQDLHGVPAKTGQIPAGSERGPHGRYVLAVPSLDAVISIEAPDAQQAQRILDTVTPVGIDSFGCPSRSNLTGYVSPSLAVQAKTRLVPGRPTSAAICTYSRGWLAYSNRLNAAPLVDKLNALPAGTLPAAEKSASSHCRETADVSKAIVLHFAYADSATVRVVVRYTVCAVAGLTNGSRQSKMTPEVLTIVPAAGYDVSAVTTGK